MMCLARHHRGARWSRHASALEDAAAVQWLRHAHETSKWTTSVCTGSLLLGAAGVLEGKRATTHWILREMLAQFNAEPVAERVVVEGKVITAAGVSAGIDMALQLAAMEAGEDEARALQLVIEYDPDPPFDSGSFETADAETKQRATAHMMPANQQTHATA